MFSYDSWTPQPRSDAYCTPCGRYSVERTGAERFDVYGPAGFVDWFFTMADAKILADELSEKTASKQPTPRRHQ